MTAGDSPASTYARGLVAELIRLGVRDAVVCPGSRSQAWALAFAEAEADGRIRLRVRIDERSAGFLALGLAAESGRPVPLVVTSGTAVANLHPAVLEAHHSRIPLIVLSADRPAELRGIRANQTTAQAHLFGTAARLSLDEPAPDADGDQAERAAGHARAAVAAAIGEVPGPVQLNVGFREPLSTARAEAIALPESAEFDTDIADIEAPATAEARTPEPVAPEPQVLERGPRTVVIAGNGAGPDAEELAHQGGWPLIAEVSSGSRYGRALIVPYRDLLDSPEYGGLIERVIVFGHPTLSRQIPALLRRTDVETWVVSADGIELFDPGHSAQRAPRIAVAAGPIDRDWLGHWVVAAREITAERSTDVAPDLEAAHSHDPATRLAYVREEFKAVRARVDRRLLVESVWRATWPHDRLVFGASRLIRVADEVLPGKKLRVFANRGLAGIDGTIATSTGIALAQQAESETGLTRVVLGDLTLLHDVGGMLRVPGEQSPRIQIIVGNDHGGTIFAGLEVAESTPDALAERVLYTPQEVDLEALARAYGWEYRRAKTRADLDQALTAPTTGPVLIEVPLTRD
ncbi:2-succinyl-5-enolpyruvyl-6-hydroxy-3-cyclohexene-1-carboxylic-acid synthase [Mycetocola tolaasinivorans]|uniref:2-succinyl-5-enolpyruvyl-6-hydroxy-3-cyclohexene-1-carboxylate synthase n=1 Tax=Mycetocola tolaasinivorans TaxID=76635 RepID=A0A3L7A6I2_9MICO|nr:2-succinyl-5-enolpyruvyl-6-hydroxy-3-cyclohexene-1-carboxylic-acid synthase [Mycetocola tolaasinivorans]RLP75685.1 2-succinyl-5-enolpyruvyl-6-hydroxy-3-cyclohexene-1-carboxylic-acid synthase [Mycetocola tolaasinivorans]